MEKNIKRNVNSDFFILALHRVTITFSELGTDYMDKFQWQDTSLLFVCLKIVFYFSSFIYQQNNLKVRKCRYENLPISLSSQKTSMP